MLRYGLARHEGYAEYFTLILMWGITLMIEVRRLVFRGLFVMVGLLLMLATAFPQGQEASRRHVVKCGRDSVFLVSGLLGVDADLQQIDQSLGYRYEVSLSEVRRVLEEKGFYCHAVILRQDNANRLCELFYQPDCEMSAIVALPGSSEGNVQHFAVVLGATSNDMNVLSTGEVLPYSIPFASLGSEFALPVLLVSRSPEVGRAQFLSGRYPWKKIERALASPILMALLLGIALVQNCPSAPRVTTSIGSVFARSVGRYPARLFALCFRRPCVAVAGIGLLVVGIFSVVVTFAVVCGPPLTVEPTEMDLGRGAVGSNVSATYHIRNHSLHAIELDDVKTSCGCLRVNTGATTIPALGSTWVRVNLMVPRTDEASFAFFISDKARPEEGVLASLKCTGYESARLEPTRFQIGECPLGGVTERTVTLHLKNYQGPDLPVTKVEPYSKGPIHSASILAPARLSRDGSFELHMSCNKASHVGEFSQDIVITAGDESSERSFVVTAYGTVSAALSVTPKTVCLKSADGRDAETKYETVRIVSRTVPFKVVSVEVSPPIAVASVEDDAGGGNEALIRLTPVKQNGDNVHSAVLSVVSTHPRGQHLSIPVFLTTAIKKVVIQAGRQNATTSDVVPDLRIGKDCFATFEQPQ